jgi:rubrerythrin
MSLTKYILGGIAIMEKAKKVKLSELSESTLLGYEEGTDTLTPSELFDKIAANEDVVEFRWFVLAEKGWKPDAQQMLTNYIESESQEMYENWDERAADALKQAHIDEIQRILDHAFKDEHVSKYWVLTETEVIIDYM